MESYETTQDQNPSLKEPDIGEAVLRYAWHTFAGSVAGGIEGYVGALSVVTWYHIKKEVLREKIKEVFDPSSELTYGERLGEIFHHTARTTSALGTMLSLYVMAIEPAVNTNYREVNGIEAIGSLAPLAVLVATNVCVPLIGSAYKRANKSGPSPGGNADIS